MRFVFTYSLISLSLVAGCRDTTTTTTTHDLGGTSLYDLAGADTSVSVTGDMPAGMNATLHDIDTGAVAENTVVTIPGLVVIGPANYAGVTKSSMKCKYDAYLQDPNGQAPDGIRLFITGGVAPINDAGQSQCPYPPQSGTVLDDATTVGDEFTVTGKVSVYSPTTDAGIGTPQHEIDVTSIVKTASGVTVTPTVITDGTQFGNNGAGYVGYESMVVTIAPAQPFMIDTPDKYGDFNGGGAHFAGNYRYIYGMKGMFPAAGATFKSITGVATPSFGGGVAPRSMADFAQ